MENRRPPLPHSTTNPAPLRRDTFNARNNPAATPQHPSTQHPSTRSATAPQALRSPRGIGAAQRSELAIPDVASKGRRAARTLQGPRALPAQPALRSSLGSDASRRWRVEVRSAPDLSTIASGARDMSRIPRFAAAESPERGTPAHPPGLRPNIRAPRPPDEHSARHAGTQAAISANPPRRPQAPGGLPPAEHDQTRCIDPHHPPRDRKRAR